tara:strand:+ start:6859 stop:7155 length:297 start_codon:yes stop_codon:yes gene_type:complete
MKTFSDTIGPYLTYVVWGVPKGGNYDHGLGEEPICECYSPNQRDEAIEFLETKHGVTHIRVQKLMLPKEAFTEDNDRSQPRLINPAFGKPLHRRTMRP